MGPSKDIAGAKVAPYQGDLIIGVRRIRGGNFSGLYEVVELNNKCEVIRVVTDANNKSLACSMAAGLVARCL